MPPNFHSILYDFFIKGHELNYIAGTYETSWYEVAEVLDSELARKYMRSALRVQRIRAAGKMLRSRLAAIQTLESTITERRDSSHSSIEASRRAATAILSGTNPRGKIRAAAAPKSKVSVPQPSPSAPNQEKQSVAPTSPRESAGKPTESRREPATPPIRPLPPRRSPSDTPNASPPQSRRARPSRTKRAKRRHANTS